MIEHNRKFKKKNLLDSFGVTYQLRLLEIFCHLSSTVDWWVVNFNIELNSLCLFLEMHLWQEESKEIPKEKGRSVFYVRMDMWGQTRADLELKRPCIFDFWNVFIYFTKFEIEGLEFTINTLVPFPNQWRCFPTNIFLRILALRQCLLWGRYSWYFYL